MAAFQLTVSTAVRGYHVYKDVWFPELAETFHCQQDTNNKHDRYAVSVFVSADALETVGHLPREISKVCFYFLQHDGSIHGEVTGRRSLCTT
jgi:hypothetical protein